MTKCVARKNGYVDGTCKRCLSKTKPVVKIKRSLQCVTTDTKLN